MSLSRLSSMIVSKSDQYKYTHFEQYPPGTEFVESYLECRTGAKYGNVVFFGLQYYLMEYLEGVRFTENQLTR